MPQIDIALLTPSQTIDHITTTQPSWTDLLRIVHNLIKGGCEIISVNATDKGCFE